MRISYSDEPTLVVTKPSIFLAGPTPRSTIVKSWRPDAIRILEELEYEGQVIVPERSNWKAGIYIDQVEWERIGLEQCSKILFWVPRDLKTMPSFTTNVEFGRYVTASNSKRVIYGRPNDCPKNRYLDWLYTKETNKIPISTLPLLMNAVVKEIKNG